MDRKTLEKILSNSGLIAEADLNFEEPKKEDDGFDLSFDDGEGNTETTDDLRTQDDNDISNDSDEIDDDATPRERLHKMIEPQVEIAKQVQKSISNAFDNIETKKFKEIKEQIRNFEKQIRGAAQQVIAQTNQISFDTTDTSICSPKAFKTITQYDSRDKSVLDLIAAIIVFSNSLT